MSNNRGTASQGFQIGQALSLNWLMPNEEISQTYNKVLSH